MKIPKLVDMLKNGVHFGHQTSRWHPKMAPYIFGVRNSVHILDLEKTSAELEKSLTFLKDTAASGGTILFVGTKRQAQEILENAAKECGMPYVNKRWLGGMLTNFPVILKLLRKYRDLKSQQESGKLATKYTKKEQLGFARQIKKLDDTVGGIGALEKIPDVIFILDIRREKTAYKEAQRRNVTVVGVCDTNVDPTNVDYVIPANDDATRAIEFICNLAAEAIKEGKANPVAPKVATKKNESGLDFSGKAAPKKAVEKKKPAPKKATATKAKKEAAPKKADKK